MWLSSLGYVDFSVFLASGFIIQFAVLTLICFLLAIIVLLLEGGYYQWILDLLLISWSVSCRWLHLCFLNDKPRQ